VIFMLVSGMGRSLISGLFIQADSLLALIEFADDVLNWVSNSRVHLLYQVIFVPSLHLSPSYSDRLRSLKKTITQISGLRASNF